MKRILLLFLLIAGFAYSQSAYLTYGDSILTKRETTSGHFTFIAVTDSSNSATDSLIVETWANGVWVPTAVRDYATGSLAERIIPGNGNTRLYIVYFPTFNDIRIRRTNVANLTVRTFVTFYQVMAN